MRGGVADYTFHLGASLMRLGADVRVLTSKDEPVLTQPMRVLPVVPAWNVRSLPRMLGEIRRVRPHAVGLQYVPNMYHRYGVPLYLAALAFLIWLSGIRLVTTFHEVAVRFDPRKPKYWGLCFAQRMIAWVLAAFSSEVVITVPYYRRLLRPFASRARVLPIGSAILPVPLTHADRETLRARLAPGGEILLATFGLHARRRHLDRLIEALHGLRAAGHAAKLLILGAQGDPRSPAHDRIVRKIEELRMGDAVVMTGYLEAPDLFRHLAIADLFVHLDFDPHGGISTKSGTVIAACAAGLPIVANLSRVTDAPFRRGTDFWPVDRNDATHIAAEIARLAQDPALRRRLADAGHALFQRSFQWDRIARDYLHVCSRRTATTRCPSANREATKLSKDSASSTDRIGEGTNRAQ
ncbi:MAG: glycosyltransferase family 4 protein [Planctomycetes bacterium]|nr:glycosyltransferase family 4 protein [Planctomycetota bacterium]